MKTLIDIMRETREEIEAIGGTTPFDRALACYTLLVQARMEIETLKQANRDFDLQPVWTGAEPALADWRKAIPEGWETMTKKAYRGGEWKFWSRPREDWFTNRPDDPMWERDTIYIQPKETK
jgi:hypothetical protein